jgi:cyclopropane-fatty-acyl-phospholipid synthase
MRRRHAFETAGGGRTRTAPPGGNLPIAGEIVETVPGAFRIEDWRSFDRDYAPTAHAWHERFVATWAPISAAGYDERFRRLWEYFLPSAAGMFRARRNEVWQIVLSAPEYPGVYRSVPWPAPLSN